MICHLTIHIRSYKYFLNAATLSEPLVLTEMGYSVIWFGLVVNLDIVCGRADFPPPQPALVSRGFDTKRLKLLARGGGVGQLQGQKRKEINNFQC